MINPRQLIVAAATMFSLPLISSNVYALTCSASADTWNSGYVLNVEVTNDSNSAINGWELALDFNQSPDITNSWNAELSTSGSTVTATQGSWNGNIAAGQSVSFGFQGTHNGNFVLPNCVTDGQSSPPTTSSSASSVSSSSSTPDSSSSASSNPGNGGDTRITVRALGTTGSESITLSVGGTEVQSWTLSTSMMDYSADTDLGGDVRVAFTNDDDGDADARVDYVIVNGQTRQAEDQSENTGAWGNNECGGGSNSEWLHCNGHINFGAVAGGSSSSSSPSSSSSSSSSSSNGIGSAGCGAPLELNNGRHSINVGGMNREYIIDVPNNYDMNTPHRLVFGWHWRGGSADNVANEGYYGLKGQANGTAIFVAPDRAPGEDGWTNTNGRDMDFLRAMLNEFGDSLCIDEERIFSAGWSYGGMMSFAVGREMGDTFRAIAPASGALWTPYNDIGWQTAAWIYHGSNDNVVGYDAGVEARDLFLEANNCSNNTVPSQPSQCVEYQNCDAGQPVVWCADNGGHMTPSFYASAVWEFFSRF